MKQCECCGERFPESELVSYDKYGEWKLCPVCAADWARTDALREKNLKLGYSFRSGDGPACELCGRTDDWRVLTTDGHVLCNDHAEECGYYECDDDGRYAPRLQLKHTKSERGFSRLTYK